METQPNPNPAPTATPSPAAQPASIDYATLARELTPMLAAVLGAQRQAQPAELAPGQLPSKTPAPTNLGRRAYVWNKLAGGPPLLGFCTAMSLAAGHEGYADFIVFGDSPCGRPLTSVGPDDYKWMD